MKPTLGLARRLLLAVALLGMASPSLPQTGGHTIELIVFRNGGDTGALGESVRRTFTGDDLTPTMLGTRQLGGVAQRLNSGGRRVLAHVAWRQAAAGLRTRRGVSAARLGVEALSGKIYLERGTYLHLGVELVVQDGARRYLITELRQLKPGELNYFDHPAVGVIALVSE